jgi:hypothetical protein
MEQSGVGDEARISFLTHTALTKNVEATIRELKSLGAVDSVGACLPVIEQGAS